MYIRQKYLTNSIPNEIDQVETHLILVRKTIGINPNYLAMDRLAFTLPDKYSPIQANGNGNQGAYLDAVPTQSLLPGVRYARPSAPRPGSYKVPLGRYDPDQNPTRR